MTSSNFIESNPAELQIEIRRHRPDAPWTYADLDRRQRQIAERVKEGGGPGALLLSEVAPVITLGRRTPETDLLMPEEALGKLGISLYRTDRGGLGTYHGPGQWVLFAVDRLERLTGDRRGVRKAVEALLGVALSAGRHYNQYLEIRSGMETGVWSPFGKVAALGIHIENGVLHHGVSVNGYRTPASFMGLRPCGLEAPVDFLLPAPDREEFERLGRRLLEAASQRFWSDSD